MSYYCRWIMYTYIIYELWITKALMNDQLCTSSFLVISRTFKNIYWGYSLEAGNVKVERYRDIERPSCRVSGLRISDLESPRLPIAISWNEGDEVEYNPAVEAPTQTRLQTRLSVNYFSALLSTIIFRLREQWVTSLTSYCSLVVDLSVS